MVFVLIYINHANYSGDLLLISHIPLNVVSQALRVHSAVSV